MALQSAPVWTAVTTTSGGHKEQPRCFPHCISHLDSWGTSSAALDQPLGHDIRLGDGGRVLSGGEQQRIAMARARLGKPDLLILDEATSALDPASEAQVAEAVIGLKGKMTMLVIAHRGMLTEPADCTYRLDQSRLVS